VKMHEQFPRMRPQSTAFMTPAPIRPPINAWDELVGRPTYQVMMSHAIAPTKAPRITFSSIIAGVTMPEPIVFATATPKIRNATKLKKAAILTAANGDSTRVAITVVMELAASWNPLKKSNE